VAGATERTDGVEKNMKIKIDFKKIKKTQT